MPTTSDNKLDLLFKKFIGIPLSNPSGAAASEAAGSSKLKIIPSLQIFSQSIPSTAPTDLSNVTFTPTNSGGTKQISSGNTHIAKYTQLGLAEVQPQTSYRYANPSVSTNLTSPAIPGNYDVAGSTYAITLYGSDGTTVINPSTYPWVFDTDSGYVTFIDPSNLLTTALAPPKITFWRYEGTFGLGTSSGGSSSGAVTGDLSSNGNLFIAYDTSLNSRLVVGSDVTINNRLFTLGDASFGGNITIEKDLTIKGRLNVQNYTNTNIINTTTTNYQIIISQDLSLNGNLTSTGNLNAVSDGNVDSINFWTLTKYMNSLINAPPAVTFGNVDTLSTMIRIPWTYPTQYNIGLTDTLIPVINSLTVTYTITKSGTGSTQTGTIIDALATNSYIKNSLNDTYPITGVVLLKSAGSTTGYINNYTFTAGNRNAYVFTDSNIQDLTSGDLLTLNVLYTNNNTSTNTAQKTSLNFLAAGTPSAPVYRSSTLSTTSVTITIGNPQYGDANNTTTNTTITRYSVKYSSTSNATRYGGVKSSELITANTTVSVTPTGTANVSANTTDSITTNIYPETTYTANITAVNNVNSSVGAYSGNFTFTTTSFTSPSTAWSTGLSFSGLPSLVTGYYGNNTYVNSLLLNLSSTYTTSSMTTIINDFERRGVNGAGNSATISANVVLNGTATSGPSISVDANIGNITISTSPVTANNITITPINVLDNYYGNSIGYDGYYKKYTGTVSLASGLFVASPYQYTVNLSRTSGNSSATANSSYSFYYDSITGVPGTPSISSFAINTTSYSQVCGINVIYGSSATFTTTYSVSNLGQYFYKYTPITYSSTGDNSTTIITANETTIPSGNVYGNLLIYNPVNFNSTSITSTSLTDVFTTSIPLTITASNFNGNSTQASATTISAIIDGPSASLVTNSISTLSTISNTSSYNGARYFAGSSPDSITSNNNSVSSLFSSVTTAYNHTYSIASGETYGKELQIANGYFVTKASSYGYLNYTMNYSSSLTNNLNYSSIPSSGYRFACFAWKLTAYEGYNYITFTMNTPSGFNRSGSSGFQPLTTSSSSLGATTEIPFYYKVEDSAGSGGLNTYWIKGNNSTGVQINNNVIGDAAQSTSLYSGVPSSGYSTITSSFKVIFPSPLSGSYNSNTYLYCIIGLPMDANCYFKYMSAQIS